MHRGTRPPSVYQVTANSATDHRHKGEVYGTLRFNRRAPRIGCQALGAPAGFTTRDDVENQIDRFMERALSDAFDVSASPEAIGWGPAIDLSKPTTRSRSRPSCRG
jgi:hypothetical protein